MALRLLCETAAKDKSIELANYIKKNFAEGKKNLDQNAKTTLSTQNVNETSLIQLLHIGAHQYHTASNLDQTIAVSIIIAEMLKITHGQKD
jgi:hypothetical protein